MEQDSTSQVPGCSILREQAQLPVIGTAAIASAWIGLEQPGPWGKKAITQSHLDPDLGKRLDGLASAVGARLVLLRRPGMHANGQPQSRVVQFCGGLTSSSIGWLVQAHVDDPAPLADLDFSLLNHREPDDLLAAIPGAVLMEKPALWVCTNGKRDLCCATRARPLVAGLTADLGDQVWEATHLGGHRFAPTALIVPTGLALGGLTPRLAIAAMAEAAAGQIAAEVLHPLHDRGRGCLAPMAQVAEHAVRRLISEHDLVALEINPIDNEQVQVTHRDTRSWVVRVERRANGLHFPVSCGAEAEPSYSWEMQVIEET